MRTADFPALRRGLVAILRGLRPDEAEAVGAAVHEAGIDAIEVPLNSPDPFRSIAILRKSLPETVMVGAGTVVHPADVERLAEAGGRLLVSPNIDPAVMQRAAHFGLVTMPGVFTPSEALLALRCGASALKFFPASVLGAGGIAALRAVLPAGTIIGAVGGVSERNFADYAKVGVTMFGLGTSLFTPGSDAATVGRKAREATAAWDAIFGGNTA